MRSYCSQCSFPQSTCLCPHINAIASPVELVILQHSKEVTHAKNTARLVSLCVEKTTVYSGIHTYDFNTAQTHIEQSVAALLYPGENSQPVESVAFSNHPPSLLILLDGSWSQAYALYQRLGWLHHLPQWHFTHAPPSAYRIRHTAREYSLSTLEAAAYALQVGYGVDSRPLHQLQQAMQEQWRGPAAHQRDQ